MNLVVAPDQGFRTLGELCSTRARTHAHRLAAVDDVMAVTYSQLFDRARSVGSFLRSRGVVPGDRVVVQGPNTVAWVVAAWGCLLAGASVVPLGHRLPAAECRRLLAGMSPRLRLVADELAGTQQSQGPDELTFTQLLRLDPHPDGADDLPVVDAAAEAVAISSSGTGGRAKVVSMTHRQLIRLYGDAQQRLDLDAGDVWLGTVPLAHSFGFNGVLLNAMISGCCVRLLPRYSPSRVAELVRRGHVTVLAGPPTLYRDLAQLAPADTRIGLAIVGSTEVPAHEMRRLAARLGIERMVVGYGMTETCGTIAMGELPLGSGPDPLARMVPLPDIEVGIRDEVGRPVPAGVRGRIAVRGYNVSPRESRSSTSDPGWFDTGDVGELDRSGRLAVVGRRGDIVLVSGFTVHPREVEEVLQEHEQVTSVAVVGVADARRGERLVACVVPTGDAVEPREIVRFARERLAGYKVPDQVLLVGELPVTQVGKVSRAALRRIVRDEESANS